MTHPSSLSSIKKFNSQSKPSCIKGSRTKGFTGELILNIEQKPLQSHKEGRKGAEEGDGRGARDPTDWELRWRPQPDEGQASPPRWQHAQWWEAGCPPSPQEASQWRPLSMPITLIPTEPEVPPTATQQVEETKGLWERRNNKTFIHRQLYCTHKKYYTIYKNARSEFSKFAG